MGGVKKNIPVSCRAAVTLYFGNWLFDGIYHQLIRKKIMFVSLKPNNTFIVENKTE